MTRHTGSCHCGRIAFTLEADTISEAVDCNCSLCRKRGGLLSFHPRTALTLTTPESALATYTFNKHHIQHHFCAHCGIAPLSFGTSPKGDAMVAINLRCLDNIDLGTLTLIPFDGKAS